MLLNCHYSLPGRSAPAGGSVAGSGPFSLGTCPCPQQVPVPPIHGVVLCRPMARTASYDGADSWRSHQAPTALLCPSCQQRLPPSLTRSSSNSIRSLSAPKHLRTLPPRRSVLLRDLIPVPAGAGLHHLGKARPTSAPPRPNPVPAVASAREYGSELRSQALPPPASRRSE